MSVIHNYRAQDRVHLKITLPPLRKRKPEKKKLPEVREEMNQSKRRGSEAPNLLESCKFDMTLIQ